MGVLSFEQLESLSRVITERLGLHFPPERHKDLLRGITGSAKDFGFGAGVEACAEWLLSARLTHQQIETLAAYLTIGETYFFREKKVFDICEKEILPKVIASREKEHRLRLWSAGCSTGEEAYSLAILIHRMLSKWKDWNILILATDINVHALKKAQIGRFGEWSFRDAPSWLKDEYFSKSKEGFYELIPEIKESVSFEYHNLSDDPYPSLLNNTNAMDLIFCRNVLMYFEENRAKVVIQSLANSLVREGVLVVGQTEVSHELFSALDQIQCAGVIFYQKGPLEKKVIPKSVPEQKPFELPPLFPIEEPEKEEPLVSITREEKPPSLEGKEEDSKILAEQARSFANAGKLEKALLLCNQAKAQDKSNSRLFFLEGSILQEKGEIASAIQAFQKAIYLDAQFVLAYYALAFLYLRKGKEKKADTFITTVLTLLEPLDPETIVPESDGITVGRFEEIVRILSSQRNGKRRRER